MRADQPSQSGRRSGPAGGLAVAAVLVATGVLAGCTSQGVDLPADSVVVDMVRAKYVPDLLTVPVGTTVVWVNKDPSQHTITPLDPDAWGTPGSDHVPEGGRWSFTFDQPGTFDYRCLPHSSIHPDTGEWFGQLGTVVVEAA